MSCKCGEKKETKGNPWTTHLTEYKALCKQMVTIAEKQGCILNADKERSEKVLGLMTENLVATGKPYCPCKQSNPINLSKDVTCPCPDWKKEIKRDSHCFCRLFYRKPSDGQTRRSSRTVTKQQKRTAKGGSNAGR